MSFQIWTNILSTYVASICVWSQILIGYYDEDFKAQLYALTLILLEDGKLISNGMDSGMWWRFHCCCRLSWGHSSVPHTVPSSPQASLGRPRSQTSHPHWEGGGAKDPPQLSLPGHRISSCCHQHCWLWHHWWNGGTFPSRKAVNSEQEGVRVTREEEEEEIFQSSVPCSTLPLPHLGTPAARWVI